MAVTLGIEPKHAILNDINKPLINFYKEVQKGLKITIPFLNDKTTYYEIRKQFNVCMNMNKYTSMTAQWFYYLNKGGFNGLCRFNKKGEFNVPFGSYKTISHVRDLTDYTNLFLQYQFMNVDFEDMPILTKAFVYADPPYDECFSAYSGQSFTWEDQERLAHWLAKHDCPVVASNKATERIINLYNSLGFTLEKIERPSSIAANKEKRKKEDDILITKNF